MISQEEEEDVKDFLVSYHKYLDVMVRFRHLSKEEQTRFIEDFKRDTDFLISYLKEIKN